MPRRRANWTFERTRAGVVNAVTDLLPDDWDAVIPPDTDEIPFADPALGAPPDLIAAARGAKPALNAIGLQVAQRADDPPRHPRVPNAGSGGRPHHDGAPTRGGVGEVPSMGFASSTGPGVLLRSGSLLPAPPAWVP